MKSVLFSGVFAVLFLIHGCSTAKVGAPDSEVTLPKRFTQSGSIVLDPQWWQIFRDKELNRLIHQALHENFSLQAAWERLEQARATAKKNRADLYPDLTLSGSASSTRNTTTTKSFSLGVAAGYELDLWGRVRSIAESSRYDLLASEQNLRSSAVSLSAEIATAWFNLQEQHKQINVLGKQSILNKKNLILTEQKFRSGLSKASDVLQQRQNLEAIKAEKIVTQNKIALYKNQLAVLLGQTPGSLRYKVRNTLPAIHTLPNTGIPSELLMQRPDVKAAYFKLKAYDSQLYTAIANRYPKFTISASVNGSVPKASDIFDNWIKTLAAGLTVPLLDGNYLKAEAERTKAVRNEALYTYKQTLLEALKEVEDALSNLQYQKRYVTNLNRQLQLAKSATEQIREQYLRGNAEFVSFLNAQLSYEALQRKQVTASRESIEYAISLYRALSTGWEMKRTRTVQKGKQ